MTSGSRSMANNNARAGASGVLRYCSQSRKVVIGKWKASANSACVIPRRCRSTLTRDTRRILASCSGVRGCASGSDSAAATTSSSVIASSRAHGWTRKPTFAVAASPGNNYPRPLPPFQYSIGWSTCARLLPVIAAGHAIRTAVHQGAAILRRAPQLPLSQLPSRVQTLLYSHSDGELSRRARKARAWPFCVRLEYPALHRAHRLRSRSRRAPAAGLSRSSRRASEHYPPDS